MLITGEGTAFSPKSLSSNLMETVSKNNNSSEFRIKNEVNKNNYSVKTLYLKNVK